VPVVAPPVFSLDLCADAYGEELAGWIALDKALGADGTGGGFVFGRRQVEVPQGGVVEVRGAEGLIQRADVADEAGGFGLEICVGGWGLFTEEVDLGGGVDGDADLAADAAEAEEFGVSLGGADAAGTGEIDEHVGVEPADGDGEAEELWEIARAGGVADVAVDEAGVLEDGGGGRGLGGDGKVGEEVALGVGEGAGDEVQGGESDEGIAE